MTDQQQPRELYLAPTGNDSWTGRFPDPTATRDDGPLATLAGARDAVRRLRAAGCEEDLTVWIRGGVYPLRETVVFGLEDSAPAGSTTTYAACEEEEPLFTSGVPLTDWHRPSEPPAGLPEVARDKVWVAEVPSALGRFRTLYDGTRRLPRARSRGYRSTTQRCRREDRWNDLQTLHFPPGALRNWDNLEDVEVLIRPNHVWVVNYLGLAAVDEENCVAQTTIPATYNLNPFSKEPDVPNFWVENVLETLDQPGEWVLDTCAGKVYLWPLGEEPGDSLVAPCLRELVRVEGRNVDALDGDVPVRGLRFVGLTLTCGDRDVWTPDGKGLQHDWEMWDKDNALLRFRGAEDCAVERCRLVHSGGGGIRCDRHAQGLRLVGNRLYDLGGTGVLLCGYGPGLKDVNKGNLVAENNIQKCGQVHFHNPGVFVWQSGENQIRQNRIHDFPYDALVLSGVRPRFFDLTDPVKWTEAGCIPEDLRENMRLIRREETGRPKTAREAARFAHARNNVVEDNEVHDAMQLLGDGNALYFSCAGSGNTVRRNLVYNCPRAASQLRFDDDQEDATIEANVVLGPGVTLKHNNFLLNNYFFDGYLRIRPETETGCRVERNLFCLQSGAEFCTTDPALLALAHPDRNLYFSHDQEAGRAFLATVQSQGHEQHGQFADPLFVDAENFDFRLRPESPAHALGILPIEVETIGLPSDPAIARIRRTGLLSTATSGELLPRSDEGNQLK